MTRKSSPGGAAPYWASLISLSVPSTPTRRTSTSTPRPSGTSSSLGSGTSRRWIECAWPGWTAIAFMPPLSAGGAVRYVLPVQPVETSVVEALRAGDESAFRSLVREYGPSMLRVARMYVGSRAVAEEVVQETWVAVLRGIDRFEGRSSLKTWIFRILMNTAKTRAQREARSIPFSAAARDDEPSVDSDRFLGPDARFPGGWAL